MTTTLSYAQSLDGRIATVTGASRWISGDATVELTHGLRDEHDAILVGIGTVIADDPKLTCRIEGGTDPHRIVLDSSLRTPFTSHICSLAGDVKTTIFCGNRTDTKREHRLRETGVEIERLPHESLSTQLPAVIARLEQLGVRSLMVEGGTQVLTSFFRHRLVDRVVLVAAPIVIGDGTQAVADLGITELADAPRGRTVSVYQAGDDIVWEMQFERE